VVTFLTPLDAKKRLNVLTFLYLIFFSLYIYIYVFFFFIKKKKKTVYIKKDIKSRAKKNDTI
jgi:hypothetical protein